MLTVIYVNFELLVDIYDELVITASFFRSCRLRPIVVESFSETGMGIGEERLGTIPAYPRPTHDFAPSLGWLFMLQRTFGMKVSRGFALSCLLSLAASPAFAQFNLNDAVNAVAAIQGNQGDGAVAAAPEAAGLLNTLGSELNITPEQAIGGAGAMLGLAKNRLSEPQFSELSKSVPGLDQIAGNNLIGGLNGLGGLLEGGAEKNALLDGLLGNVKDFNDLNNTFSALGMDSGMIGRFAPVILEYLGQQGVASSLLQNLGGIWGTGAGI